MDTLQYPQAKLSQALDLCRVMVAQTSPYMNISMYAQEFRYVKLNFILYFINSAVHKRFQMPCFTFLYSLQTPSYIYTLDMFV